MNLFGKKKAAPQPKISDTIQKLREAQDTLDKREKHLEKQVQAARDQAKEKLKQKDKRGALHLLKRSKLLESQINQIYGKKSNLDTMIFSLEAAASNKDVFDVMRVGTSALKQATAHTDVDKVSDMMDDLNEQIDMANEVNEQMAQPIGPPVDEDELSKELEEMESEIMDQQMLAAPAVPSVSVKPATVSSSQPVIAATPESAEAAPAAASSAPAAAASSGTKQLSDKEAKEMRELEMLMGM